MVLRLLVPNCVETLLISLAEAEGLNIGYQQHNQYKNRETQSLYADIIQPIQGCFYYYSHNPDVTRRGYLYFSPTGKRITRT